MKIDVGVKIHARQRNVRGLLRFRWHHPLVLSRWGRDGETLPRALYEHVIASYSDNIGT